MIKRLLIAAGIFLCIWLYIFFPLFRIVTYILAGLFVLVVFYLFFIKKYDEYERGVIFRLGRFNRVAGPGWSIVIPFFEKEFQKIDVRTHMLSVEVPLAFTKDDLRIKIDGLAYYRIVKPDKAVLQIDDYEKALQNLLVSQIRNVIGSMMMRDLFTNLDYLNQIIKSAIIRESIRWGIDIPSIQLKSIQPPEEIAIAMQQKEISAQQLQAQRFLAEAKKIMIEAIGEAANKLSDKAIMYFYIKALEKLGAGKSTKILFPASFINVLEGLGSKMGGNLSSAGIGLSVDEIVNSIKEKLSP